MERPNSIYVSYEVRKALWLIAKSGDAKGQKLTADEIADRILSNNIKENHPQILEHLRDIQKMEKELLKTL
jgi:hypothetical protein